MTPPRVCPPPEDCQLYDRRLEHQGSAAALRRAILRDQSRAGPSLADLIRQDALNQTAERTDARQSGAPLPAPEPMPPLPLPIDRHTRGGTP